MNFSTLANYRKTQYYESSEKFTQASEKFTQDSRKHRKFSRKASRTQVKKCQTKIHTHVKHEISRGRQKNSRRIHAGVFRVKPGLLLGGFAVRAAVGLGLGHSGPDGGRLSLGMRVGAVVAAGRLPAVGFWPPNLANVTHPISPPIHLPIHPPICPPDSPIYPYDITHPFTHHVLYEELHVQIT